jgi:hypothetical protein
MSRVALTACMLLAGACSMGAGARPAPSAAELNARADIEETRAASAPPNEAQALRGAAAEHRSAARTILDRQAWLCADVPEAEREHPSFLGPSGIEGVRPAMGERRFIKTTVPELRGAELTIRATAVMTKQWVARLVRCHVAWHDAVGPRAPEALEEPFFVGAPDLSFSEAETGFVIRIRGSDKAEGEEILRRARRLALP